MSIQLFRVDERLIHGQVVIGWGRRLHPRRFVVVDDGLAGSAWEQELYTLSIEDQADAVFLTLSEARAALADLLADAVPTVLLTRSLETMVGLAQDGALSGQTVNLGGLHPAEGRTKVRSWLNLDGADAERVRRLVELGATVEGRDLPDNPAVGVAELLPGT